MGYNVFVAYAMISDIAMPPNDQPISAAHSHLDVAMQIAAEAFASKYAANVTATLNVPGQQQSTILVERPFAVTIKDAAEAYAVAVEDACGVVHGQITVAVRFIRRTSESSPFFRATLSIENAKRDVPTITVDGWGEAEFKTLIAANRK